MKDAALPLLLLGESEGLAEALMSGLTAAASPVVEPLPSLAAEMLSLRLGGEDVHLVFLKLFEPTSELPGHGSGEKLRFDERSGLC